MVPGALVQNWVLLLDLNSSYLVMTFPGCPVVAGWIRHGLELCPDATAEGGSTGTQRFTSLPATSSFASPSPSPHPPFNSPSLMRDITTQQDPP